ncbi:hypothetical protein PSACC_02177 [Paramicrosporidium saccamoebae]|uniref:CBS domain-containing protein n=1 Tax=Paramicrosporidium saccamoebae TaxID=1246581 RepID=A0A2H9TJW7_9FUNG|nr:hypothetical protein PSACC_02177 [Paramicrosporidium saccamoebae]
MQLRRWLEEHRAEDVWRARRDAEVVFSVTEDVRVGACMEAYNRYGIRNLLVQQQDRISWLRLEDVLRWYFHNSIDAVCSLVEMKTSKTCGLEDSISRLLELWDDDWLDPIILMDDLVAGVITAADVLHYLYIYGYHLDCVMDLSATKLDWQSDPPLLPHNCRASECLQTLLAPTSSGVVGLVDRRGLLVGNVTLADFHSVQDELALPITVYLEDGTPPSLLTCSESLTCGDVLKKILQHQAHHVWRLDSYARPVGILHLHHIISFLKRHTL